MSEKNSLVDNETRKALLQQQMAVQRYTLLNQVQPIIKTGRRLQNLIIPDDRGVTNKKTIKKVTFALLIAIVARRNNSWLGQLARYIIKFY